MSIGPISIHHTKYQIYEIKAISSLGITLGATLAALGIMLYHLTGVGAISSGFIIGLGSGLLITSLFYLVAISLHSPSSKKHSIPSLKVHINS